MINRLVVLSVFFSGVSMSTLNSSSVPVDEFLKFNQKECFVSRNIGACLKYKAGKMAWKLATNSLGYFPTENSRALNDARNIRIVHLAAPSDMVMDSSSRNFQVSSSNDSEIIKTIKFLQRTAELFARNHGLQIVIPSESGARISSEDVAEAEPRGRVFRGDKKKRKWLLILPLIILMKIAHLKMTVVPLLLATLGLNVILIGGGGWLIHYLKYKTLCKIHPHFVQSHSHVYDSDPNEYSSFIGSSDVYSGGNTAGAYYTSQEPGLWNTRKNFYAYSGYKA